VKPWESLGQTRTPDGSEMRLTARDGEFVIWVNGKTLMSSRRHGSEEALAAAACQDLTASRPRVLVGGLGMGFTLRAALDLLPPAATATVAELVPAVVEWNRGPLGPLADHPLRDPRVHVEVGDVREVLLAGRHRFDAILLDVDNGPAAFTTADNLGLYGNAGVAAACAAMKAGGVLAVWSAWEDRKFEHRLRYHGLQARSEQVRARRQKGGARHVIFVGRKPASRS
jgi:spermidine synthase